MWQAIAALRRFTGDRARLIKWIGLTAITWTFYCQCCLRCSHLQMDTCVVLRNNRKYKAASVMSCLFWVDWSMLSVCLNPAQYDRKLLPLRCLAWAWSGCRQFSGWTWTIYTQSAFKKCLAFSVDFDNADLITICSVFMQKSNKIFSTSSSLMLCYKLCLVLLNQYTGTCCVIPWTFSCKSTS